MTSRRGALIRRAHARPHQAERHAHTAVGEAELPQRFQRHTALCVWLETPKDRLDLARAHSPQRAHGRADEERPATRDGTVCSRRALDDAEPVTVARQLANGEQIGHVVQAHEVVVCNAAEADGEQRLA